MASNKKIYRSSKNRILGGVCGGIGDYFNVDPVLIRLLFIISIIAGGAGIIIYLICWIIIPNDPKGANEDVGEEIKEAAQDVANSIKAGVKDHKNDNRYILGLIILVAGILLLIRNITGLHFWDNFWPILIIILGLFILFQGAGRGQK